MRLIFLGPPGAGKGTQASILAENLGILHISTGELLRQERKDKTKRGVEAQSYIDRGALVPDRVVMEIVHQQLTKPEAKKGWILDGFPRNVSQADALDELLIGISQQSYDCVISFEVPESVLVERLKERAIKEGRTDDTPEVLRNRLQSYHEETAPLIKFYGDRKKLETINGFMSMEAVTGALKEVVEDMKKNI
ncbi:MAG: adenylate kinase [Microcoleus sp. PH2017_25_DOB_D_A]|uniref:adenylate kinase n=1 Tax=unclassified Microcoleus TaxID=2642155 RepID=UPI001DD6557F|nr:MULTISPECIES: adenylate kinase [unclassified Microcoleus]TAE07358.1 MAG: adenylate kinase [Oscillatoriales cyanobacterium]MCC3537136.1 adenylate kinase [Microcoleus sp. PH2017_25_DOB_D_A]MCC3549439.1 adenylate kinase [Microcoleus sp. PH2017_24_DOB_U_A]TAE18097.1 MAG: adenylate kinase [Oscillatoriales cyanobacterium]TAE36112.1 MAG: adenylate kinase [Oscillatoriales cyanobacterium]